MTGKAYNDVDDGGSRVVIPSRIAVVGIIYIIPGIIEYSSKENNRNFIYIVFKFLRVGEGKEEEEVVVLLVVHPVGV